MLEVDKWGVQDWSEAISAGGTIMGAVATIMIALIVHGWSVRQARQQVTHEINLAFRTYNLTALSQPSMMEAINLGLRGILTTEQLMSLFTVYYRLSTLNDVFEAKRNRVLPNAFELYSFDAWIDGLCRNSREALDRALSDPRGLSPEFTKYVRKRVAACDKADLSKASHQVAEPRRP